MNRIVLVMVTLAIGATIALAQSNPIVVRQGLMKQNNKHAKEVRAMVRGSAAYDQAKVNAAFQQWQETAQKLPGLFPPDSKTGQKTRALPKIWQDRQDFDAKIAAFAKAVANGKGKVNSVADLKTAFTQVNNACNNCHEDYRRSRQRKK